MGAETDCVEVRFTMTADDLHHGFRAMRRSTLSGKVRRIALVAGLVLLTLSLLVWLVLAFTRDLDSDDLPPMSLLIIALGVGGLVRLRRRRAWAEFAAWAGELHASIDDSGIRAVNDRGSSAVSWTAYRGYLETDRAFVLLSSDEKRTQFTVLPKRGLAQPSDADRLRAILSEHLSGDNPADTTERTTVAPGSGSVELRFRMTADDLRHGARSRVKAVGGGWRRTVALAFLLVLVTLPLVLWIMLVTASDGQPGEWIPLVAVVVAGGILGLVIGLFQRRLQTRLAARMGNVYASFDEASVRTANDFTFSESDWSAYGSYLETDRAFVLLSPDEKRSHFTVLPKRGLAQLSDADRLRALLSRHLPRLPA